MTIKFLLFFSFTVKSVDKSQSIWKYNLLYVCVCHYTVFKHTFGKHICIRTEIRVSRNIKSQCHSNQTCLQHYMTDVANFVLDLFQFSFKFTKKGVIYVRNVNATPTMIQVINLLNVIYGLLWNLFSGKQQVFHIQNHV